jgi:hypothetical protein
MSKLTFRESGGIAGQIRGCEIEISDLPKPLSGVLKKLSKAHAAKPDDGVRDAMQYEIRLDVNGQELNLRFDETSMPEGARELVDYLNTKSSFRMPD